MRYGSDLLCVRYRRCSVAVPLIVQDGCAAWTECIIPRCVVHFGRPSSSGSTSASTRGLYIACCLDRNVPRQDARHPGERPGDLHSNIVLKAYRPPAQNSRLKDLALSAARTDHAACQISRTYGNVAEGRRNCSGLYLMMHGKEEDHYCDHHGGDEHRKHDNLQWARDNLHFVSLMSKQAKEPLPFAETVVQGCRGRAIHLYCHHPDA